MKLDNQEQLKHLPHIEDLVFLYGNDGLIFINSLFVDLLKEKVVVKCKIDGAPSVIVGWRGDKFFVATKSLFNKKTPKINFSDEDISSNHPDKPELQKKLSTCLAYLKDVIPNNGVEYQGDLMFTDDIKNVDIGGSTYSVFKPNTIAYGTNTGRSDIVPTNFKMGIVFHTSYSDNQVDYNPDLSQLKKTKDVLLINNDIRTYELSAITRNILKSTIEKWLIGNDTDFSPIVKQADLFTKFINKRVKESLPVNNANDLVDDFVQQNSKFDKRLLIKLFACFCKLAECKKFIMKDMQTSSKSLLPFEEFYLKDGVYTPSDAEGYVTITDSGIVKLVDRLDFSKENFNQEKDWN